MEKKRKEKKKKKKKKRKKKKEVNTESVTRLGRNKEDRKQKMVVK